MKKSILVLLLTALFSTALTCACASIREEAEHDERFARLFETYSNWQLNQQMLNADKDAIQCAAYHVDALYAGKNVDVETSPTVKLPASLQFIEDEAFEGTAFAYVEIPETVESIGENAFANIPMLRSVKIPEKTKQIASTSFAGNRNLTICGAPNSYARTWAKDNGVPFTSVAVVYAGTSGVQISASANHQQEQIDEDVNRSSAQNEKKPKWRPANEIQADQYEELIANYISGRAPPTDA